MSRSAPHTARMVCAPLQGRSRRTLERILAATEALLADRPFETISVADIVKRARTSTGSFYARFANRDAVLPALYERYDATVAARVERYTARRDGRAATLAAAAERIVRHFVTFFRERVNLLRALALFVRQRPGAVGAEARRRREAAHEPLLDALLANRDEIRAEDPRAACRFGLYVVVCACRDRILFAESTHAALLHIPEERFIHELSRMLLGYLRCAPTLNPGDSQ